MFEGPEKKFQRHIADFLIREHKHSVLIQEDITDTDYYLAEDHFYAFLRATQQETLERLEEDYGDDTRDEILKALRNEIEHRPLWTIIRTGLSVRGHNFHLYIPKPRSSESIANKLYGENRISFMPELVIRGSKRIDFGFFLNGLPIITMELKHEKNQTVHDAVSQYVSRDHNDLIFQLPFLHIAADTSDVKVSTDPCAEKNFLWFNTGVTNKSLTENEYPVEFLYREVLSKDNLLEAIAFYLIRVPKREARENLPERPAYTIYPRYHQRRCVEKVAQEMQCHFTEDGNIGRKFLVNHSAGSGKTLTMCWMADRLQSLFKPGTSEKMVNMIFLLTDRRSLDKNIRDEIENFSHLKDVVHYAKRAGDLSRFLKDREQIIVTTQQKFHYILEKIANDNGLKQQRVAFIIDEAHRSQEGRMATSIREPFRDSSTDKFGDGLVISDKKSENNEGEEENEIVEPVTIHDIDEPDAEDIQDREDPQDQLVKVIKEHDLNQLFIAFTATPSSATIQLFGHPFDTYSEEEAIAEGYIVDVAQSIISYKTLYHLHCPIIPLPEEERLYPPGVVSKALKNVAFQDHELIQYKSEVMLRIFQNQIKPLINDKAKAMIVATSRLAGLEYFQVIKEKLRERGADYKVLYAFSNFIHPDTNELYTEYSVNKLNEGELIEERFDEDNYRLMIVASKFQTGFDQPLLAGMFLDKAVADRNAVQTVSRLNRCHPDKKGVVIVDFTNNAKAILKAFNKYRRGSPHEPDEPDRNKCIELYNEILEKGVFVKDDIPPVLELIRKNDDANLQSKINAFRDRFFKTITNQEDRKSFVYLLEKFVKSYHFLNSFFSYEQDIRNFVAFCEYVGPQLIKTGSVSELMKQVRATVVEKAAVTYEGEIEMPGGSVKPGPHKGGGSSPPPKKVSVQDMISRIREKFDISDEEALRIREVSEEKIADESVQQTVAAHQKDTSFLETEYHYQLNGDIQDAYAIRQLYEELGDPKYIDKGAIFDIMAYTVIQKSLEIAPAA